MLGLKKKTIIYKRMNIFEGGEVHTNEQTYLRWGRTYIRTNKQTSKTDITHTQLECSFMYIDIRSLNKSLPSLYTDIHYPVPVVCL